MAIVAPFLPYEKLRGVADEFLRQHHDSGDLPVPIERIIEFKFGLDIVPVPGLKDEFDVDAFITSDLSEIRVDRFISERRSNRYRFSLAHELAHVLIHRDIFAQLAFSTIKEWKGVICSIPEQEYRWIEYQAYCLGGLMLVPAKPLEDCFRDYVDKAAAAGVEWAGLDARSKKHILSAIARVFDVSVDVITKRMHYDKLG
jgi:hypothetical protein